MKKMFLPLVAIAFVMSCVITSQAQEIPTPDYSARPYYLKADNTLENLERADAVELKYFIANERGTEPSPSGTESDPDIFRHSQISSKALFVLNFSAPQQVKRVVAAMRWLNLTNPANNSGWSNLYTIIIS